VLRLLKDDFIPVAGDDWYQRRRKDAEGDFFRGVANQRAEKGEEGASMQGIYALTASGKLLSFCNIQDAEGLRDMLKQGLDAWSNLPVRERRAGAIDVPKLDKVDPNYVRTLPAGGLVLNVFTRILDRDRRDRWIKGTCDFPGGELSARDHLWLTRAEWQSLVPAKPVQGDSVALPESVARRLLLYHCVDNTRGEPSFWEADQLRKHKLTVAVENVTENTLRLRIAGTAVLATDANVTRAKRGFDARLSGVIDYDRQKKTVERFDMLVIGDHWGEGEYTPGARAGRMPLGIVFELTKGDRPADLVVPQAARDWDDYIGKGK
jgi:hypothetical protein